MYFAVSYRISCFLLISCREIVVEILEEIIIIFNNSDEDIMIENRNNQYEVVEIVDPEIEEFPDREP